MASDRVDALVIFDATGDLAKLQDVPRAGRPRRTRDPRRPVIGVAKSDWGLPQFRDYATSSLRLNNGDPDSPAEQKMLSLLRYVDGRPRRRHHLRRDVRRNRHRRPHPVLSGGPPFLFGRIAQGISAAGRVHGARVTVEKPFGHDLGSAQELNATMHRYFL